jgi:hypothetical protein
VHNVTCYGAANVVNSALTTATTQKKKKKDERVFFTRAFIVA